MKSKKKLLITIVASLIIVVIMYNTSLGRYILNKINNYIIESKHFYFNSSILDINNPVYNISNWDGVNTYYLTIDVNSKKNELVSTDADIEYQISVDCPTSVICSLNKTTGVIYSESKIDSYILSVTPIENFNVGEQVIVKTSATSTIPYSKTISATYNIGVENYGFSSQISDSAGSKYLTLELTNSKPYYEVVTSFSTYQVGDHISLATYDTLSSTEKQNCISARVSISFDPNLVLLDLTSDTYLNKISETTQTINNYNYVNNIVFDMKASINTKIIFYKVNVNNDYTNQNIVTVQLQN